MDLLDCAVLLRGDDVEAAEQLQSSFADATASGFCSTVTMRQRRRRRRRTKMRRKRDADSAETWLRIIVAIGTLGTPSTKARH